MSPLLTDLYQITMAHGYYQSGMAEAEACFHLFFRHPPFRGGYAIVAGLESVIQFVKNYHFTEEELAYLSSLEGNNGKPLLESDFLNQLSQLKLTVDIDAIPEGTVVFGHEPLIRVKGPLIQAQLLESAFLALVNFPTLIATKAARVCQAAQGDPVLEFGMRRAQGIDGGLTASRAAYIGGCVATSNVMAGKRYGIPVKGTHAHSWVQAFSDETESFATYAQTNPNNCILLVDTYNTIKGVQKAITIAKKVIAAGHRFTGIRLDSGDIASLSIEARKMLDEAGLTDAQIFASNDLDEYSITDYKRQGACVDVWGVGTHLSTAFDEPALGGVYKLSAIKRPQEEWVDVIKLSEQLIKVSNPGIQQVKRYFDGKEYCGDLIYDERVDVEKEPLLIDPLDATRSKKMHPSYSSEDLLTPIFRKGKLVYSTPALDAIRDRSLFQQTHFKEEIRRFMSPSRYPVGISASIYRSKLDLIHAIRIRENC